MRGLTRSLWDLILAVNSLHSISFSGVDAYFVAMDDTSLDLLEAQKGADWVTHIVDPSIQALE